MFVVNHVTMTDLGDMSAVRQRRFPRFGHA